MLGLESGANGIESQFRPFSVTTDCVLDHSPPPKKQPSPTKLSLVLLVSFSGLGLGRGLLSLCCLKISSAELDYNIQSSWGQ